MGEVYKARDEKLNREVALKVLPADIAHDEARLMRFKREAQVLASLNHPNIASIYGLEDSNHIVALVMELVEGPALADRIASGPLPVEDARQSQPRCLDSPRRAYGRFHPFRLDDRSRSGRAKKLDECSRRFNVSGIGHDTRRKDEGLLKVAR